jgi:hypothetical protein
MKTQFLQLNLSSVEYVWVEYHLAESKLSIQCTVEGHWWSSDAANAPLHACNVTKYEYTYSHQYSTTDNN